jgi:hypothetical protein
MNIRSGRLRELAAGDDLLEVGDRHEHLVATPLARSPSRPSTTSELGDVLRSFVCCSPSTNPNSFAADATHQPQT